MFRGVGDSRELGFPVLDASLAAPLSCADLLAVVISWEGVVGELCMMIPRPCQHRYRGLAVRLKAPTGPSAPCLIDFP